MPLGGVTRVAPDQLHIRDPPASPACARRPLADQSSPVHKAMLGSAQVPSKRQHSCACSCAACSASCGRGCRYNLTSFAMKLNEVTPGLEGKLAPTDCRLRPDQRATELGQYDKVISLPRKICSRNTPRREE